MPRRARDEDDAPYSTRDDAVDAYRRCGVLALLDIAGRRAASAPLPITCLADARRRYGVFGAAARESAMSNFVAIRGAGYGLLRASPVKSGSLKFSTTCLDRRWNVGRDAATRLIGARYYGGAQFDVKTSDLPPPCTER